MGSWSILVLFFLLTGSAPVAAQFKLYEKGHDSYTSGKYNDAIKNLSEYLTKPTRDKALDVEVFYLRALSYYKTNDFKNAIPDFEETILLGHPNKGNIYWFKAKCNEKTGAVEDALDDYTYALREMASNPEIKAKLLYERSLVHSKMGNITLAYADLREGIDVHPGNGDLKKEIDKLEKQNTTLRSTLKLSEGKIQEAITSNEGLTKPAEKKNDLAKKGVATENESSATEKRDIKPEAAAEKMQPMSPPVNVQPTLADFYKDEKRYALVIGNSNYPQKIGTLKNPVNDATDMAEELRNSNFEVQLLTNATYGQIRAALLKFKSKLEGADPDKTVALFYFAGHGVQFEDENYLVPIDAAVEYTDDISRYCFPVQRMVLSNLERSNARMHILILDACRNNPFPSLTRSTGNNGLGEMRRARGSFIAYATAPGSVASDGIGRNGLYTQELLKAMKKPGLTIEQVFKEVRANVYRLSGNKQNTWDSSNIVGEFYFKF